MISRRVAPSALRTPISRVRSVTEIIMMATTPTPPTISATLESAIITTKKPAVILLNASRTRSWVTIAKLFASAGLSPRAPRMAAVTWSCASRVVASSVGTTAISIQPRSKSATLVNTVCGIARRGSSASLNSDAASAWRPITWNGSPKILMVLPIGSRPGNSDSASLSLMMATRAAAAYSIGVKFRPARMSPPLTWIQLGLIPAMLTLLRSTPSKLTGPSAYSPTLTSRTLGRCRSISASSAVIQGIRRQGESSSEPSETSSPPLK